MLPKCCKINWLPQQCPLGYHKTYVSFVISIHETIIYERLMKISLEVAEIFGRICRFLPSCPKRCSCYSRYLWGCRPNVTKIVYNVEKFILFNILKSELQYCNPFWTGSATKETGPQKMPIFRLYVVAMAKALEESKNRSRVVILKLYTVHAHIGVAISHPVSE